MQKNLLFTIFMLILAFSTSFSQGLEHTHHMPIGNPFSTRHDIFQSNDGRIWVGADGGKLAIYDGSDWMNYPVNNIFDVRVVAEDNDGNVWLGTDDIGLYKYDGSGFTSYTENNSDLPHNWIRDIKIGINGEVWVATSGGLVKIEGDTWTVYTPSNSDLPDKPVYDLALHSDGSIWMGADNFLVQFQNGTWDSWNADDAIINSNVNRVDEVEIHPDGSIWIATDKGIAKFEGGGSWTEFENELGNINYNLRSFAIDHDGILWFGEANYGLHRFNTSSGTLNSFEDDGDLVPTGELFDIFVDSDNHKWLAGVGGGISEINDDNFVEAPLSYESSVMDVSCFGAADGAIDLTISGGLEPYTFEWNDMNLSGGSVSNLPAGNNYSVTIIDATGSVLMDAFTITEPDELTVTTASSPEVNLGGDGTATATPAGGTSPYSFEWNTNPTQTTETATNLVAGEYTYTVTDANGCTTEGTVVVDMTTDVEETILADVQIYPTYTDGLIFIKSSTISTMKYQSTLFDLNGKIVLESNQNTLNLSELKDGFYFLELKFQTSNNERMIQKIILNR